MIYVLLALVLLFLCILLLRAYRFRPPVGSVSPADDISVDTTRAVAHLREMIRCRTVSTEDLREEAEFEKFRTLLPIFYPKLFAAGTAERVDATGLLIRLPGLEPGTPAVFLGHYDVVPADENSWDKPPFEAILENGTLWGRGALDMKNQLCCMLEAAETLLEGGFTPKHDIYFALSGEEEIMGSSARSIMELFRERNIIPAFVLDEGGDIIDGFFPGTTVSCAMVGIGEKGVANLSFRVKSAGGHASVPQKNSPLMRLCRAMTRVERYSFPLKPGRALEQMVEVMGRHCDFPTRLLLSNRKLLRPLYHRWLRKKGGMIEAAARTTFALTQAQGAQAGNVIPTEATMFANMRLMYGDTQESVINRLHRIIRDPQVEILPARGTDPTRESILDASYEKLKTAIEATWPQAVVSPYLMVACTDSRHWREICDHVYRFSAKYVTSEEKATVHGNNERIRIQNTKNAVKFFFRLMREC